MHPPESGGVEGETDERMLEVFDMHGRACLKPAIPARNMPRPLLKLSSLNASTASKLTPSPPSRSAPPFERRFRHDNVVRCRDFQRSEVPSRHFFLDIGDKSWNELRGCLAPLEGVDDKGWLMNVATGRAGFRGREASPSGYCVPSFLPLSLPES